MTKKLNSCIFLSGVLLMFALKPASAQQNSLMFDGVDDKVVVPDNALFNSPNALTLEAWIYATQWKTQSYQGTIISKDQNNTSGYVLRCGDNGKLSFTVGAAGSWMEVKSASLMQANKWYHVAGIFDNGTMTIYIDGQPVGTTSSSPITTSTVDLQIGECAGFAGRVFQGYLDEVRVWNVARTQAEILANDTVNLPNNEPGLVAYYKFNQISGTTTPNEITATSNSTGTLVNFGASPWGPGYALPGPDLAATAVISPDVITFFGGSSRVRAKFTNFSPDTVSTFSVGYQLNANPVISENVVKLLQPGESFEYAFHEVVEGAGAVNVLKVFASLPTDSNPYNDTVSYDIIQPVSGNYTIPLFTDVRHDFGANGQTHQANLPLPDENTAFSQILMNINLTCPVGGCDPWDQPAKISLLRDGQTYELARFITPYNKACGPWTVDVTSFKSLLHGACNFESYIQVWGTQGWLLDVSLTFVKGSTAHPYQKITRLWETDNWVYGDPNISYDLPVQNVNINALTQELEFRMTNSGHGQANTDNAAEFSPKTHTVVVNGSNVASHYLWKADCNINPCSPQSGTWQFSRAGWCPGQEVQPYLVNLNAQLTAGQSMSFDYTLQTYTNLLNTGYNGSSHTEPHYKIHAFVVEKSDTYLEDSSYINGAAVSISFPLVNNDLSAATTVKAWIKNTGTTVISQPTLYYFVNGVQGAQENPSLTLNPGDSTEYVFTATANLTPGSLVSLAVLLDAASDQASSDDVASIIINGATGIDEEAENEISFSVYPNPSNGEIILNAYIDDPQAEFSITSLLGETLFHSTLSKSELAKGYQINPGVESGTYIIQLQSASGSLFNKLMIVK